MTTMTTTTALGAWFLLAATMMTTTTTTVRAAAGVYSYDPNDPLGPANWASVEVDNNQCGGQKNSPVAVSTGACDVTADYTFHEGDCTVDQMTFTITNNGVKASYPESGCKLNSFEIPGIQGLYQALQFHIHTSSEHTIDEQLFGAELHIIHKAVNESRFAVVGMMIEPASSENHALFSGLVEEWAKVANETDTSCNTTSIIAAASLAGGRRRLQGTGASLTQFNVYDLVPEDSAYFHYDGGLTTPPCSEVVWWNLADQPVKVSTAEYNMLTSLILSYRNADSCQLATLASPAGSTSRPPQPLNGRVVERICPTAVAQKEEEAANEAASGAGAQHAMALAPLVGTILFLLSSAMF